MKRVLMTGITGQDGSYLAELLLAKGYEVHGMIRRSSTFNTRRIDHLYQDPHDPQARLFLHYGDLSNQEQLTNLIYNLRPEEVYHLGAQSHVQVSFEMPEYTGDTTALGTTRILEAIRRSGVATRFYQASSSEMFGESPPPQHEETPFRPRSPYAAAKVYACWMTRIYREGYNLFACNGILFNHECVIAETPVLVRRSGLIDVTAIEDIVPHRTDPRHGLKYTTIPADGTLEVWDGNRFSQVMCMTATWNDPYRPDAKCVRRICARSAVFAATTDHICFREGDQEVPCGDLRVGDRVRLGTVASPPERTVMTEEEAWLLGAVVAEGWASSDGRACFVNQDVTYVKQVADLWQQVTGGWSSTYETKSGFAHGCKITRLRLQGASWYARWLAESMYTRSKHKKIPARILNAPKNIRLAFLRGYNVGDGLQAGHGDYEFKGFKTLSPVLAAGLYWLAQVTLNQRAIICAEERNDRVYYQINLNSSDHLLGRKGQHLKRPLGEIVKIHELSYRGWVFDLATDSGTFSAGIGIGWIHNSPRRGETFVTRKITMALAHILAGKQKKLYLGNLDAMRDWGYAPDYVEAIWEMLQREEPEDFVIGTGEAHTVREFVEEAFGYVGLDWREYVQIDPRYFRPVEVVSLLADTRKARERLGWEPKVTFRELVRIMVDADMEASGLTPPGEGTAVLERKFGTWHRWDNSIENR